MSEFKGIFLVSALLDSEGEMVDGTLVPVIGCDIVISTDKDTAIVRSNEKGLLCYLGNNENAFSTLVPSQLKAGQEESILANAKMSLITGNQFMDGWLYEKGGAEGSSGKPWMQFLKKWAHNTSEGSSEQNKERPGIVVPRYKRFEKKHVDTQAAHDTRFRPFNECINTKTGLFPCVVIPRTRILFLKGESNFLEWKETDISIYTPYGSGQKKHTTKLYKNSDAPDEPALGALLATPEILPEGETTLPEGTYMFEIKNGDLNKTLNASAAFKSENYTIQAPVEFNIKSPGLEMAIVNLDPVSLESALFMQFPSRYGKVLHTLLDSSEETLTKKGMKHLLSFKRKLDFSNRR